MHRLRVLEQDIIQKMQVIISIGKLPIGIKRALIFLACNILDSEVYPDVLVLQPLIDFATECLWAEDSFIISDSLWAFASLFSNSKALPIVCKTPIFKQIIFYMKNYNNSIRRPALRCVGILSSGDDSLGVALIQLGVFEGLENILGSQSEKLIREACWAISNLLACGPTAIDICINKGILSHTRLLLKTSNKVIVKEAMWVLYNGLMLSNMRQLETLVNIGVIEDLSTLLKIEESTIQGNTLKMLLSILNRENIRKEMYEEILNQLQEHGGVEAIESLQMHKNEEINKMAVQFIKDHYRKESNSLLFDPPLFT